MFASAPGPHRLLSRIAPALFLFIMAMSAFALPRLEPGVPLELARWRASHYRDLRYTIEFALEPGAESIAGRVLIRAAFRGARQDLVLDWRGSEPAERVRELEVNGRPFTGARFVNDHLIIPRQALKPGENSISLRFRSPVSDSGGPITRFQDRKDASEYWYTLFVPAEASSIFPCFDQPDLKARFTLTASGPPEWRVVSNAPLETREVRDGRAHHRFRPTEPISPYLFAFAAGPFVEINESSAATNPGPVHLYVRRSEEQRARTEASALLELNREALGWLTRYFSRPFPFAKYDLVLVPELPYGGMEHAGATFLREESVLFPFEPAASDLLRRAQLMLHETTHQWFGDLVTMRWFDDLWLKEGFANFMAAKAAAELLPGRLPAIQPWIAFNAVKSAAYRTDATQGTTPIWQAMSNLSAAKSAYGNIVYSKAPAVLRQAEFFVGEQAFRAGVRDFLRRYAFGAAGWTDLVRTLERASGRRLGRWADAWVKRRGMPRITLERRARTLLLTEEDVLGKNGFWPMRIKLVAMSEGRTIRQEVRIAARRSVVSTPDLPSSAIVFANDEDYGYGQFLLDPASREQVLAQPGDVKDDLLRALLLDSLWESVREAQLDPARYLALVLNWLPQERDEMTATLLLGRLRAAYLRYMAPERRSAWSDRVEGFLAAQMHHSPTLSRRIGSFRALVDVARSNSARERLKALYSGKERVEGLTLRSRDRFAIVESLFTAGDPDAPALLESQSREDSSAEGRRYAFGAAAARADGAAKRALFERFLNDASLPESWIEQALGPFNDLDQAAMTRPMLEQALQALPRLKRERRIFFVNDWLAAFLGGQSSADAVEAVRNFLAQSKLDPDLRLKVLEAIDALERTVKIRARFS